MKFSKKVIRFLKYIQRICELENSKTSAEDSLVRHKRFLLLVIIGGAVLIVAIVGATAAVSGAALYKTIKNEENLEHLPKEVKWLGNKAEILKNF